MTSGDGGAGFVGIGDVLLWVTQSPEWRWDHNVYLPEASLASSSRWNTAGTAALGSSGDRLTSRNLLLTQVAGGAKLKELGEISARPNRAYARQWGRDYALFWRRKPVTGKSCFDKAVVLNAVMERGPSSSRYAVQYDVIALLPPDAIITDLDFDLLGLLPNDKLVAIAGWEREAFSSEGMAAATNSRTDIVFYNLRHKYAEAVSRRWSDIVSPYDVTCGAGNDLKLLILAIQSIIDEERHRMLDDGELDINSLVIGLNETNAGFVGSTYEKRVIKGISPSVPTSREGMLLASLTDTAKTLHTTADSVCYRYYPKCEVL